MTIGEFKGRTESTLSVCLKKIVLKDRDGADNRVDPGIQCSEFGCHTEGVSFWTS